MSESAETTITDTPREETPNPVTEQTQAQTYSLDENGHNAQLIQCNCCPSKMLKPGTVSLVEKEITLHMSRQRKDTDSSETEVLRHFWFVKDMFTFENIGFTRNVDTSYKYLTCADCEQDVVGIQFLEGPDTDGMYLAASRVRYVD
ncbi:hypothetical protein PROFUN_04991 [Planoprotostelium fungivorum]|uniref:Mss4-like protein n=1 Tax=Planoprotostelium fungivorum TaxID=1890364 RepID=A0A2P6NSR7_9EUKA|nr:hypothetical protein PROFUN_04991 [Planoprotostelium fungivorum]